MSLFDKHGAIYQRMGSLDQRMNTLVESVAALRIRIVHLETRLTEVEGYIQTDHLDEIKTPPAACTFFNGHDEMCSLWERKISTRGEFRSCPCKYHSTPEQIKSMFKSKE